MKYKIIYILLPLIMLGCSKKHETSNTQAQDQSPQQTTGLPFQPTVVEPPETKEIYGIKNQASSLFESKAFDKLDALAKEFRDSKLGYANGVWKIFYFYDGLDVPVGTADSEWIAHFTTLREWIKTKPDSITARVALANGLVAYAWKARGVEYANKVADENWKIFFQRLNEAVTVLNQAKQLKEQCPCLWPVLLKAELGLQVERPQYDATFSAATQAWPDYTPLYFSRAHFLLPRWYGTEGELEKDLEKSANEIGGEAGDMVYAQVVWNLTDTISSTNLFQEYNLSWERTNKGIEALGKKYPNSLALINEAAHLAVLAHDPQAAKKYFDKTEGRIDVSAWPSTNVFIRFANLVYGYQQ